MLQETSNCAGNFKPLAASRLMSPFYSKAIDNDGTAPGDLPFEFPCLFAAVKEAKHVPAELELKVDCIRSF